MTHTLHRRGNLESLKRDFLILCCPAKGYNYGWYIEQAREFFRIALKYKPVNGGDMKTGNFLSTDPQTIIDGTTNTILQLTFDDKEQLTGFVRELKEADLGISVVITGVIEEVNDIVAAAGLSPIHTREFSLGTHGRLRMMPEYEVLEFTTMCGHAMIASEVVKKMVVDARKGRVTMREAAVQMGKCCSCGNFNVNRAVELLEKNAPLWTEEYPVY